MTLRLRLTLTAALFTMCALAVAGFLVNSMLGERLTQDLDRHLSDAAPFVATRLALGPDWPMRQGGPTGGMRGPSFPQGTYAAIYDREGRAVRDVQFKFDESLSVPAPTVPRSLVRQPTAEPLFVTLEGSDGGPAYRARISAVGPGTLLIAIPLTSLEETLEQLTTVQLAVGGGVIIVLSLITYVAVRAETSPLDRMTRTAAAIAAGDYGQRVDLASATGDVGRLAQAFDTMLNRIDAALATSAAATARLREFVADASHELRTPLTSIRGYAEMFGRADLSPGELETAMRRIEQESARMAALVDDLILLARLDEAPEPQRERVDLGPFLRDAAADAQAAAPDRLVAGVAAEPLPVLADESQLRAAVANLWRNALVHTPEGTPIEITGHRDGQQVVIDVVDHGPGIPEDQRERVFQRLWRADEARDRDHGGAGLGLSIAARIVELHGGVIDVHPTPGGGATFRISLPAAEW